MIASYIVQVSGHQAIHDDHATYWVYILCMEYVVEC